MTTPRTRLNPIMIANSLNRGGEAKTAPDARRQAPDDSAEAERTFRRLHASNRFGGRLYL